MKFLGFVLLFAGEGSVIYAEELGAKSYGASGNFSHTLLQTLPLLFIGALLLVVAYMLGLRYFHNIWIITAISFGSILLVEPAFDFFYIGQTPTLGAGVGAVLGLSGMLSALFL